ncbi:hypothetical protein HBN50_08365 [Halobacteriovorax sp. GB3]|uniref:phosphatase domain-containing protein n=1 Tax=Halobacteriovorax sp. GB3 TaxID=2719615 RepID=UPI002362EC75|nr:phosphatase domain-containing protein [Halobacteriovorax sp. GB3]MDD0853107.1 hypothetical protein [Halobacteriovorax sp. GB3]
MKRPHLVHFLAIKTDDTIALKASVTMRETLLMDKVEVDLIKPRFPIQAYKLLNAYDFTMKIVCLDENQNEVYVKSYESDSYGNFYFKIPLSTEQRKKVHVLQIYETRKTPGLEYHLGSFIPINVEGPKKLVICDFDKTLVDTRYSTTKELYRSLTSPIESFPKIPKSIEILQNYTQKGFHPFILSASPHFYEDAMRDWLYQNKVYTAGIFLKDYRKIFSLFEDDLTTKDLKIQGLYKLNHLLDILHMTSIPDEIVLMGDNFESDPLIYLGLARILEGRTEPRKMWSILKSLDAFQLTKKQESQLLNKIYQLQSLIAQRQHRAVKVKIYIRKKASEEELIVPDEFLPYKHTIELYEGLSEKSLLEKDTRSKQNDIANAENESHSMK